MIDVENDVFTIVATKLRAEHKGVSVYGEYVEAPASFPAVTIVEADNRVLERFRTDKIENAVRVMYETNVYSNKATGKKSEAKSITNTLDEVFVGLGFTRTMRSQVPNLNEATIYRIVCRYEGVVIPNDDGKFYIHSN